MVDTDYSHGGGGSTWNKESIPAELKDQNRWLIAKITDSGKPPLYPRSPTAVDRGLSFSDAVRVVEDPDLGFIDLDRVDEADQIAVGFMIIPDDDYFFIDWDDVRDPDIGDESVPRSVVKWVTDIGGYTEVSPSGTGLKTICRSDGEIGPATSISEMGKIDLDNQPVGNNKNKPHVDVYVGPQYTTVTGNVFNSQNDHRNETLSDGCSVLEEMEAELQSTSATSASGTVNKPEQSQNSLTDIGRQSARRWMDRKNKPDNSGSEMSNGEWIETEDPTIKQIWATGCKLDDTFELLWNGDLCDHNSVSEADLDLVSKLWYYSGDESRVDEAFRESGLYGIRLHRPNLSDWDKSYEKWDEETYRESTLEQGEDNDRHQGRYLTPSE